LQDKLTERRAKKQPQGLMAGINAHLKVHEKRAFDFKKR
jgi:tRNA U34 5-carboxymethylaminomethyl modifying enzyme MnmG/GidA